MNCKHNWYFLFTTFIGAIFSDKILGLHAMLFHDSGALGIPLLFYAVKIKYNALRFIYSGQ